MSDRPRIELNTVQVISSMGAAVTGAVLTSYLGDGGTILGTAVGAGVSTTGFAVYKHYLARTKEKVAPVIVEHARQWNPTTQSSGHAAPGAAQQARRENDQTRTDLGQTRADPGRRSASARTATASAGPAPTSGRPGTTSGRPPQTSARPGATCARPAATPAHGQTWTTTARPAATTARPGGPAPAGPGWTPGWQAPRRPSSAPCGWAATATTGPTAPPGPTDQTQRNGGGKHSGGTGGGGGVGRGLRGHPRWVITAVTSVAVFLIAMLVITLIEFGTGKPIDASVWGHKSTGTTLGNVTGGTSTKNAVQPTTPGTSATPSQSASPGVNSSVQPTSGATTQPRVPVRYRRSA